MLCTDFESILKQNGNTEKIYQMKAEQKGKARYTEKSNTHAPFWWCVRSSNVKINFKLPGVTNKDDKEVRKNIQMGSIDSCRFM